MKLLAALPVCWLLVLTPVLGAPQRCSSPDRFEGIMSIFLPQQLLGDYGKFSYDAVNKRWYSNLLVSKEGKQWQQVNILLHQKSVMYQYFPYNQTCLKTPIRAPFRRFAVPENATFLNQIYIGLPPFPGTGLLLNGWIGILDGATYVMTFMEYKCLPQYQAFTSTEGWFSESFTNLTLGIQDPSVFIPPPECGDPSQEHSPDDQ